MVAVMRLGLFFLVCAVICLADDDPDEYDRLFDVNVDVDTILDNDRVLTAYLACFYDEGPCAERPLLVKGKIREVLETTCSKCKPHHRERLKYVMNKFIDKRPDDWQRILEIYDPEAKFRDNVEKLRRGVGA